MAGRLLILKQYPIRKYFEKNQLKKLSINILSNDVNIPFGLYYNKENQGKMVSKSTFHSRCNFSGRAKANLNKFKMSRMIFKKYSEFGLLNGIRKASW